MVSLFDRSCSKSQGLNFLFRNGLFMACAGEGEENGGKASLFVELGEQVVYKNINKLLKIKQAVAEYQNGRFPFLGLLRRHGQSFWRSEADCQEGCQGGCLEAGCQGRCQKGQPPKVAGVLQHTSTGCCMVAHVCGLSHDAIMDRRLDFGMT